MAKYEYTVLKIIPNKRKGEIINIGLAVFSANRTDIIILPNLKKITSLDGNIDLAEVRNLPKNLEPLLSDMPIKNRVSMLENYGRITSSKQLGFFNSSNEEEYKDRTSQIMRDLVYPIPKKQLRSSSSKVATILKKKFLHKHVIGKEKDIGKRLIIPRFPLAPEENIYADFALKNGKYFITETIDFRVAESSLSDKFKQAALKALTLDIAQRTLGSHTDRAVVYAVKSKIENKIEPHLNILNGYCDSIYNLLSESDMNSYYSDVENRLDRTALF